MVLRMIELGYKLDEVIFCDTTVEFPAMLRHVEKVKTVVESAGIKFTVLRAEHDFEYYLLQYKPKRKNEELSSFSGFSWPNSRVRWCTGKMKLHILDKYNSSLRRKYDLRQYVGLAADEVERLSRKNNQAYGLMYPLVDWGWSEKDAMNYCKGKGYDWEGLYDVFERVSCWCCPLQPLSELRKLREHFPYLWSHLLKMDENTWKAFKGEYSVRDLDKRFELEKALTAEGEKIRDRRFFTDLRRHLQEGVELEEIVAERLEKRRIPDETCRSLV